MVRCDMTPCEGIVDAAEANIRLDTGIRWGSCITRPSPFGPKGLPAAPGAIPRTHPHDAMEAHRLPIKRSNGATYSHDGSLEGMLSAVCRAWSAHDVSADIVVAGNVQPRLGQQAIEVPTSIDDALKVRRLLEHSQGSRAFYCVCVASGSENPDVGSVVYRFIRHAVAVSGRTGCFTCPRKSTCIHPCAMPSSTPLLDDLGAQPVFELMSIYRQVMNERHKMLQFLRFEHRRGDVWYARCHPNASVVPLLMDWFVARFNDQRFVIHDARHGISGLYDGSRWSLVSGSDPIPPGETPEEEDAKRAWRAFYRNASIPDRYHPELRRDFMPMRLWQDLPELQPDSRRGGDHRAGRRTPSKSHEGMKLSRSAPPSCQK